MTDTQNKINKQALAPYRTALSRHLRALLTIKGKSYTDIIEALATKGVVLEEGNLRGKISRGEMPADLFVLIMDAIGAETDTVIQIIKSAHEG